MNTQNTNHTRITGIVALVLIIATIALLLPQNDRPNTEPDQKLDVQAKLANYIAKAPPDKWWLDFPGQLDFLAIQAELVNAIAEAKAMGEATGVSELVSSNLTVTVYSMLGVKAVEDTNSTTICLFGGQDQGIFPGLIGHGPRPRVIMMAAVNWPGYVLQARLMREFELVRQWNLGGCLSERHQVISELRALTLQIRYLDHATSGRYSKALDQVIDRYKCRDARDLALNITEDELFELDRIIGAEKGGREVRKLTSEDHLLAMMMRWSERKKVAEAYQINFYKWIREAS